MSLLTRAAAGFATRALPGAHQGIGDTIAPQGTRGPVKAATGNITYATPGQPAPPLWDGRTAIDQGYFGSMWVLRCCRTIADTIAGLPYRAGPSVETPSVWDAGSPLARLLGPAPGGPNPTTAARAFWAWSIVQYLVTGRFAWELQTAPGSDRVIGLWPLVAAYLEPIPSSGGTNWFDGFVYKLPTGERHLTSKQVLYVWRPSARDWREPESALEAARLPVSVQIGIDRYMWALLKNGMVASTMVISPPFEEADQRRAWQAQFMQEFTGFDSAGKTIFAEFDDDDAMNGGKSTGAGKGGPVQVERLAESPMDAQMIQLAEQAKIDITVALGVPMSLIGNASQRTFSNADSEYRNFWTITVLPLLSEIQDPINMQLAPRVGNEVGWFDLRRVVALQPSTSVVPPAVKDLAGLGLSSQQILGVMGITSIEQTGEDVSTAPIGEEAIVSGPTGSGSSAPQVASAAAPELRAITERLDRLLEQRINEFGPSGPSSTFPGGTDKSNSGLLLPPGPVRPPKPRKALLVGASHRFTGRDLTKCSACGHPYLNSAHIRRLAEARHAGGGHAAVPSGHVAGRPDRLVTALRADAARLAPDWERTLSTVTDEAWRATQDRLGGKRGRQLVRRTAAGTPVDAGWLYDQDRWEQVTADRLAPLYTAAGQVSASRTGHDPNTEALDARRGVLARKVTQDTFKRLGDSLRAGVESGDEIHQLFDRTTAVFDAVKAGASRLARVEAATALALAASHTTKAA